MINHQRLICYNHRRPVLAFRPRRRPAWRPRLGIRERPIGALAIAITLACLVAAVSACGGDEPAGGSGHGDGDALFPRLPKVTGHIDLVEPDPDNPRHFRSLNLTDAQGRRWSFRSEGWVGVSVGHLKDHQIHGTTVTVWYEERPDGINLARFVGD